MITSDNVVIVLANKISTTPDSVVIVLANKISATPDFYFMVSITDDSSLNDHRKPLLNYDYEGKPPD